MTSLTLEQRFQIALDMLCAKLTTTEVCYKHGISASCAYHIKNRALEVLRTGIGQSVRQSNKRSEQLLKRLGNLEQLACDQALAISILKRKVRDRAHRSRRPAEAKISPGPYGEPGSSPQFR